VRAARTRSSRSRIATSSTHPTPVGPPSRPHSSGTRDPVKLADSPPGLSQGCQPASRGHVHLPQTRTMEEQSTVKVTVDSLITFKLKVGAKRHRCSLKTPTLNLFDGLPFNGPISRRRGNPACRRHHRLWKLNTPRTLQIAHARRGKGRTR
jgi:hypothetical protein